MFRIKARGADLGAVEIVILAVFIQPVFRDQRGACHLPAAGHGAEQFQERDRPRGRRLHVAGESRNQPVGRLGQRCNAFGQRAANHRKARMTDLRKVSIERPHLLQQQLDGCALFIRDLAADEIVGLDSRGALVDRRDTRIAQILCGTRFLDETHAAVDLHTRRRNFDGLLGAPALHHRRQQIEHGLIFGALRLVRMQQRLVEMGGGQRSQRAHRLGLRLHAHQHAAHVRMMNDADAISALDADFPALDAVACVDERMLISAFGDRHPFDADFKPREIHHREHVFQATILLADQIADRTVGVAVGHHAGRAAVDAELVLDGDAFHIVAFSQAAAGVDQEFRHDEQRNAFHALRRVRRAREHHVDDVLRHVVLAPGDEDLGAVNPEMIAFGQGSRAYRGKIRTRLRFGEIHRPGPFAGHQVRQIGSLLRIRAMTHQ